jgi:hypothetical protein
MNKKNLAAYIAAVMGSALIAGSSAFAGTATASSSASDSSPLTYNLPSVSDWWNGKSGTANWLGLGYILKDYGLSIEGGDKETFLGNATPPARPQKAYVKGTKSGASIQNGSPADIWGNEIKMNFIYDFGKVFGLNGLSIESDWRYREVNGSQNCPYAPNAAGTVGNSSMFNPDKDTSGMGVRILPQFVQYQTGDSKDPNFLIKAGWINPYEDFLRQPDSKGFENNAIASAKGIGGAVYGYTQTGGSAKNGNLTHSTYSVTAVPWSSSYASWGGMVRKKPSSSTYLQSYLGLAMTGYQGVQSTPQNSGSYNNHGFNFEGAPGFQTGKANQAGSYTYSQNGVYNVNEFGWEPKLGDAKLAGHYAVGNYIWGINNNSYGSYSANGGHSGNGSIYGFYIQGDQRLTAVQTAAPAAPSLSKNPVDSKNPVPAAPATYDKVRGLYSFTEATYTPANACSIPFYFQTGLVYKGLFNARPNDKTGIVWGEGFYSYNLNTQINAQSLATKNQNNNGAANGYAGQNYSTTGVFEYYYDVAINKWLDFIPDAQYIINPAGNGSCVNALVLGATISAKF